MTKQDKNRNVQIKVFINTLYQFGCIIGILGLIIFVIGISLHSVFELLIFDQRKMPTFHQLKVKVGLFGSTVLSLDERGNVIGLMKPLELTDSRWKMAKLMAVIGILTIICAETLHIITSCFIRKWRKWWIILLELSILLASVICILICLSLAESEIELIHDSDDFDLKFMLHKNGLMVLQEETRRTTASNRFIGNWNRNEVDVNVQEYNLILSSPKHSYYLFIASEFCILASFLCILTFFIKVSDQDEKKKRLADNEQQKLETSDI